jgi:hypothetical protein
LGVCYVVWIIYENVVTDKVYVLFVDGIVIVY